MSYKVTSTVFNYNFEMKSSKTLTHFLTVLFSLFSGGRRTLMPLSVYTVRASLLRSEGSITVEHVADSSVVNAAMIK